MQFEETIETIGKAMDAIGVAVIVIGFVVATAFFARELRRGTQAVEAYSGYRQGVGRAILLGLEVLVAADIIRTVAVAPTFTTVGVLAIIVVIRTLLSISLQVELEGRWPWQAATQVEHPPP